MVSRNALAMGGSTSASRTMTAFVNGRAVFRDQVLGLDDILHAKWDASERTVSHLRLRKHLDPGVDGRIHAVDALQAQCQCLFPRGAAGSQPVLEAFEP